MASRGGISQPQLANKSRSAARPQREPGDDSDDVESLSPESPRAEMVEVLRRMVSPDQVIELRALNVAQGYGRPVIHTGYYDYEHLDCLAADALHITGKSQGVYFTLNPINQALLARRANRLDQAGQNDCAKDSDVTRRNWLLVDVDPVRPTGVSATDAEKTLAWEVLTQARDYLHRRGWPDPITCDSGNGYHLLYRIDLPADDSEVIKHVLLLLAHHFDTAEATVDTSVHNPARICKLPGTLARKGDSVPDRPYRWSSVVYLLRPIQEVPRDRLEELAGEARAIQEQELSETRATQRLREPTRVGEFPRLLVEQWLTDNGVQYRRKPQPDSKGRTAFVLSQCPFDASHADPDSCIMQAQDG